MTGRRRLYLVLVVGGLWLGQDSGCLEPDEGGTDAVDTGSAASPLFDKGQSLCYDTDGAIACSVSENAAYYGQDAIYSSSPPSYTDNGDGTVVDNVTGLMWTQEPELAQFDEAESVCSSLTTGGYDDWRVPSITELYSLIDFDGSTGRAQSDALPRLLSATPTGSDLATARAQRDLHPFQFPGQGLSPAPDSVGHASEPAPILGLYSLPSPAYGLKTKLRRDYG